MHDTDFIEKLAGAEYVGRMMARSYLEKLAEDSPPGGNSAGANGAAGAAGAAAAAPAAAPAAEAKPSWLRRAFPERYRTSWQELKDVFKARGPNKEWLIKERLKSLGKGLGRVSPEILGTGALGYGLYRLLRGPKEKQSSVDFDALVEQRALELLNESGWLELEKTASDDIDTYVDTAALALLEELGYPVEWY
jgi:hypothetical protein